jgi:hypothetical protein
MKKTITKLSLLIASALLWNLNTKAQTGAALNILSTAPADNVVLAQAISTNSLVGKTKITVEAWVRPTSLAGNGCIVGNYTTPTNQLQFLLRRNGNAYLFLVGPGNAPTYSGLTTAANTATINIWQHVACVYDGTTATVYINGVFSASNTTASNYTFATTTNSIIIGTNSISESFDGDVDELRIWNINRSRCEINTFMNCEIPTNATNLVANYHFNQGTAAANNTTVTTLNDATSNAFNGTLNSFALTGATSNWVIPGGVVSGSVTPLPPPTVTANSGTIISGQSFTIVPGGASTYSFVPAGPVVSPTVNSTYTVIGTAANSCTNSASSIVSLAPGTALNFISTAPGDNVVLPTAISNSLSTSNKLTVEAWVRPTNVSGPARTVIGNYSTPGNQAQFFVRANTSNYQFWIGNSAIGGYMNLNSSATPTLNAWQHIAGVWNGTVSSIYINGVLSGTASVTYTSMGVSTNSLVIGGNTINENFDGNIDEVRIWNRALCQNEIQNNMTGEIATTANGLLANYHFNQGIAAGTNTSVTTLTDASGNAYTGTLTGIALTGSISNWVTPGGVVSGSNVAAFVSPTLSIAGTNTICAGSTTTLTASGNVSTYAWVSGPATASNVVTPSVTTTYSVIGTNSLGCQSNVVTNMVTVNTLPTVTAVSNASLLCVGQTASLTANGAATYLWNTSATTTVIAVSPTVNTNYTVTGTTNGCSNTFTLAQAVSPCTGIQSLTNGTSLISIYPNPSNGMYTIETENATTINVVDVLGKVVYTQKLGEGKYNINLTNLNNGLYILKADSDGQIKTVRLIKE